jgi:phosphoribosylformimino-5-aminoimidazole carboxamide ribotide isomerase
VTHIVIGSLAVTRPTLVKNWLNTFSDSLILALDVKCNQKGEPFLATQGWQERSARSLWAVLEEYEKSNLQTVLCTDINKDGVLSGPNFALYESAKARYPHLHWQASGGIHTLEDLKVLKELELESAIIGRALYENKFTLQEALGVTNSC